MISIMEFVFSKTCFNEIYIFTFSNLYELLFILFLFYLFYYLYIYISNFHFDCPLFENNHMPGKYKVTYTREKQNLHIFLIGNQGGL